MHEIFNDEIAVPSVSKYDELASLLQQVGAFEDDRDITASLNELRSITGSGHVGLGVKPILRAIEGAQQDMKNAPSLLAENLAGKIAAAGAA